MSHSRRRPATQHQAGHARKRARTEATSIASHGSRPTTANTQAQARFGASGIIVSTKIRGNTDLPILQTCSWGGKTSSDPSCVYRRCSTSQDSWQDVVTSPGRPPPVKRSLTQNKCPLGGAHTQIPQMRNSFHSIHSQVTVHSPKRIARSPPGVESRVHASP